MAGRSPAADLILTAASVSAEHAIVFWQGEGWYLRDLHSSNGTFVNRQRLAVDEPRRLQTGDSIQFGAVQEEHWDLVSDTSPSLFAKRQSDGMEVVSGSDLLALPSEAQPTAQVYPAGTQHWSSVGGGALEPINDGQSLSVGKDVWRVFLPSAIDRTEQCDSLSPSISSASLVFRVSQDEETVVIEVSDRGFATRMESRVHNYALLLLARQRQSDIALREEHQGWMARTQLARQLGIELTHLNVQLFRLRKAFSEAGFDNGGQAVECRRRPDQVRIGIERLRVERL